MVNKDILTTRVELVNSHLDRILPYDNLSYKDFLKDVTIQDIVEYNLFQTVNHLINIIEHIVVDEEYGLPKTAYEAAVILKDKDILNKDDLDVLKKMIGFRNVVGHDYIKLNKEVVYAILTQGKGDIPKILFKITEKFL